MTFDKIDHELLTEDWFQLYSDTAFRVRLIWLQLQSISHFQCCELDRSYMYTRNAYDVMCLFNWTLDIRPPMSILCSRSTYGTQERVE